MSKSRNQNNLLVEIMIAVLFFALCATVILETFAAAREFNKRSAVESAALAEAQDINERLYAAGYPEELLAEIGYEHDGESWQREYEEYRLEFVFEETPSEAGTLRSVLIQASRGEEVIFEMPGARYLPGGGS